MCLKVNTAEACSGEECGLETNKKIKCNRGMWRFNRERKPARFPKWVSSVLPRKTGTIPQ